MLRVRRAVHRARVAVPAAVALRRRPRAARPAVRKRLTTLPSSPAPGPGPENYKAPSGLDTYKAPETAPTGPNTFQTPSKSEAPSIPPVPETGTSAVHFLRSRSCWAADRTTAAQPVRTSSCWIRRRSRRPFARWSTAARSIATTTGSLRSTRRPCHVRIANPRPALHAAAGRLLGCHWFLVQCLTQMMTYGSGGCHCWLVQQCCVSFDTAGQASSGTQSTQPLQIRHLDSETLH